MTSKKPVKKASKASQPTVSQPVVRILNQISNFLILIAGNIAMILISTLTIYNYDNPAPVKHVPPLILIDWSF